MDEMEEIHSAVIECPHCHVNVLPTVNNICPACRRDISDPRDTNPNQVALVIHESEDLPSYCYLCDRYTKRTVRVSGDEGIQEPSLLPTQDRVDTSDVIIYLPQCDSCADLEDPEPIEVDYEYQKMTFVVHKGFHERVLRFRDEHSGS